jgi:very-short-patch-repair endonuclease
MKHTFMMSHVILTRQLLARRGQTAWQIERSIRIGEIERTGPGTFAYPGVAETEKWLQDLSVLLHRCGPKAVASHRSAARLHGLDGDWGDALDVLAPPTGGVRQINVFRSRTLLEEHATTVDGFRTTTIERTLVDLGRFLNADQLEMALESALRGDPRDPHVWNRERLVLLDAWSLSPRIIGHVVLRQALRLRALNAVPTASGAETLMLQILRSLGLDLAVLRQPLVDVFASDGRRISGYPDFLFSQIGLAIEVDGKAWHTSESQVHRDNRRENILGAGLRILRYTGTEIRQSPGAVANEIRLEHAHMTRRGLPASVNVQQVGPLRFRYTVS